MKAAPKNSTVTLVVLVLVTTFTALYMKGLNSGIPYYYDSIGYSASIGGTFVAAFTLASTVMRLIGGQITDHFPHYRVLLISLGIMAIGVILPAIWDNFALAMVSRVLQGASFAVATNVTTVAIMGSSSKKHIGRRMGINGMGTSLGTMFGALVSMELIDSLGYHWFYAFYALIVIVAIVAVLLLRNHIKAASPEAMEVKAKGDAAPKPPLGQRIRDFVKAYLIPQASPFFVISFARRIPKGFCVAFILIYAKYAGIAMGAAFFVIVGVTTLIVRMVGGKVFDSNRTWLLVPLQSVQIIGFIIFCVAPNLVTLVIAAIGYGLSVGSTSPLVKALMAKSTPKEHWGTVNGELFFFADIGKALGAFIGGLLIDAFTKAAIPEIALAFAIVSSLLTGAALILGKFVWHASKPS